MFFSVSSKALISFFGLPDAFRNSNNIPTTYPCSKRVEGYLWVAAVFPLVFSDSWPCFRNGRFFTIFGISNDYEKLKFLVKCAFVQKH